MTTASERELRDKATQLRRTILRTALKAGKGHIPPAFSWVEIAVALYQGGLLRLRPSEPRWAERDRFLLSKGHGCLTLYSMLAEFGYFSASELDGFAGDGSLLAGHPDRNIPGVESISGSLGHGLGVGAGLALSAKLDGNGWNTVVLMGDGECNEGMIWEAVMFASHHRLDNLVAIVDYNNLQGLGYIKDILNLSPLSNKFSSFDWNVREIDGNNIDELLEVFDDLPFKRNMPSVIIANTVKGKGISSMENKLHSHYEVLNEERYKIIMNELDNIILN